MRRHLLISLLLTLSACQGGSDKAGIQVGGEQLTEAERAEVLARIGEQVITLADFEKRLAELPPLARTRYESLQRRREFLDGLVRFELLAREAAERGLARDPQVELVRRQAMVRALMTQELERKIKLSDITDAEVAAYYNDHRSEYVQGPEVRAAHILVQTEGEANALLATLNQAKTERPLEVQQVFADLAKRHSTDSRTQGLGGDLGYFGRQGTTSQPPVPPEVAAVAFELSSPGDYHPTPIKASDGFHLVQKTGFKPGYERALDAAAPGIRSRLFRARKAKAMDDLVTSLKTKLNIEVDEAALARVKLPTSPSAGHRPELLDGLDTQAPKQPVEGLIP